MKLSAIACATLVASMGFGNASFAQVPTHRNDNDSRSTGQWHGQPQGQQYNSTPQRDTARPDWSRSERRYEDRHYEMRHTPRFDQRDGRWNARRDYYNARGPHFSRGGYIPREYRSPQYVVSNYRAHRLPAPPRNHEWVQVGADYVLIAIATGIIANIVLNY